VHGANRLGGNSLLELIVFGKQAGVNAAKYAMETEHSYAEYGNEEEETSRESNLVPMLRMGTDIPAIDFYKIREELGDIFYKNVGISRDANSLSLTLNAVDGYIKQLPKMGANDKSKIYNTNRIEFLEFKNMLELSRLVLSGALSRQESRGAHFRVDFPQESEAFASHTIIDKDGVVS